MQPYLEVVSMPKQLEVMVEETVDGLHPEDFHFSDWTPFEKRILARRLEVKGSFGYVALTEREREDPTQMNIYILLSECGKGKLGRETEIDVDIQAAQLDSLIESLTLARDAAIANWMLEPARS